MDFNWLRFFYKLGFRGLFYNRFRHNRFWCFLSLYDGSFFLLLVFIIVVVLFIIVFVISWELYSLGLVLLLTHLLFLCLIY